MSWLGALYRGVGSAGVGLGVPRWVLRGRPDELRERLGHVPATPGALWIHAASVGELAAARPLLEALASRAPRALSVMTRTGRARAEGLPLEAGPFHPPLDAPSPVARAVERLQPRAWIAVETEIWPTLLTHLAEHDVPRAVVSARLSARSRDRMRRARALYRPILTRLNAVGARTDEDAAHWTEAGVPAAAVRVTGDLKEDVAPPPFEDPAARRPTWLAACTRPGEEQDVLAALDSVEERIPSGELWIAPRHPERFEEARDLLQASGRPIRSWRQRNESAPDGWSVVLVDEMGVLDEAYRHAHVAFVGGSLRPFRGHSPWEAARAGRPVVMGPDVTNCRSAFSRLRRVDAARTVDSPERLGAVVTEWLLDPASAARAGRAAYDVVLAARGATGETVRWLEERGVLS